MLERIPELVRDPRAKELRDAFGEECANLPPDPVARG